MTTQSDLDQLARIPLSTIAMHSGSCCPRSRAALLGALLARGDVPARLASIPALVTWTPTAWPAYWCELAIGSRYFGDCGVHADLAAVVLRDADIEFARCRVALRPYSHVKDHWMSTWSQTDASTDWIAVELVHHEVLRIGNRIWDPTEACWFEGVGDFLSAGVVVAIKEGDEPWQQGQRR